MNKDTIGNRLKSVRVEHELSQRELAAEMGVSNSTISRIEKDEIREIKRELEKLPSAQPEEDCDTCKHGYFWDTCCNNCKVRFPSHYERRTDEA